MKHEKISIKWKIFLFLLIFIVILLVVLWLLQVCYLDSFYKYVRTKTAEGVNKKIVKVLQSNRDDVADQLDLLAAKNNMAIYVTDAKGHPAYNAEYIATSRLNTIPKEEFDTYYELAKVNGGSAQVSFKGNYRRELPRQTHPYENMLPGQRKEPPIPKNNPPATEKDSTDVRKEPPTDILPGREVPLFIQNHGMEHAESVIYVTILEVKGEEQVCFLNCMLTPVDATVYTLKIELLFISVFMLVLSVVLAFLISGQISKSMIRVSDSAKELARGDYDVLFEGKDYREIAELSDTLNYMAKELGKTEEFRRELIANVSHDLRTPLTMITAYSEAMRDLPGEDTAENIQVIIDEATRLTNLVNDMMDLSKLQAGVLEKHTQTYNLTESIRDTLERYNKLKKQEGYQIQFIFDRDVCVDADAFKMDQVMYNLINNAIHYTGEDKKVLVKQVLMDGMVRIEVSDSGEGIKKEDLPYIWDRYYKVDKTHKRAVKGTGLGLSIVKNILELHQAEYGVESQIGKGSTFWFELKEEVAL